ncbi:MAG: NADAR family protein, partial [Steroidobacteraceae bacterium]
MTTYLRDECVVFRKTKETWGGLSNMVAGFPLSVAGVRILTSEALYQACRFPNRPDVQRAIVAAKSPMSAKMAGKPYRAETRSDWHQVRADVMRWCLRVKLKQNWTSFERLLRATGNRDIVEDSHKDTFWGAKASKEN